MQIEELQPKNYYEMLANKKKIYIVDDDESVCRALKLLLTSYGFKVETFESAEKFFSAVPNTTPGCLILDVHMPGLKGYEVQERLLKSGSKRPIIVVTADKNSLLKDQALKAGAKGFLQKSFKDKELIFLINKAFQKGELC